MIVLHRWPFLHQCLDILCPRVLPPCHGHTPHNHLHSHREENPAGLEVPHYLHYVFYCKRMNENYSETLPKMVSNVQN